MPKHLLRVGACMGAVLGASFVGVRADETPTSPNNPPVPPTLSEAKPLGCLTSITVAFPTSSPGDAQMLLDTPVSFAVKDASFMVALDAVLTASSKTCRIECRGVTPMKLTFSATKEKAGDVLNSLAQAGGCSLYVFPNKLLLSPPNFLSNAEKGKAHFFNVLNSPSNIRGGKGADQAGNANLLAIARTPISKSLKNLEVADAISQLFNAATMGRPAAFVYKVPSNRWGWLPGAVPTSISMSVDNATFGDALNSVAHLGGCAVYILPDKFLICSPDELMPDEKKVAIPAFVKPAEQPSLSAPAA